jgi:hypothetical protein
MPRATVPACALILFFSLIAFANPPGDPAHDPTGEFDAPSDFDTVAGRVRTLVPLDQLISPADQADIDEHREAYQRDLERLIKEGERNSHVDLRFRDTPVKKQFGGTCTAFGLLAAMENLMGGAVELSPRHFWSQYHAYSSARAIRAATENRGTVTMPWWPSNYKYPLPGYLDQSWYKLSQQTPLKGDIAKAVESVEDGSPVYIAISTPWDMVVNKSPRVDPNSGPYKRSGHALAVVGYELDPEAPGGGSFLLKNSWGVQAGDQGYQWYPFVLCTKKRMYCQFWSIQGVSKDQGPEAGPAR